jgi:hypothetical protein
MPRLCRQYRPLGLGQRARPIPSPQSRQVVLRTLSIRFVLSSFSFDQADIFYFQGKLSEFGTSRNPKEIGNVGISVTHEIRPGSVSGWKRLFRVQTKILAHEEEFGRCCAIQRAKRSAVHSVRAYQATSLSRIFLTEDNMKNREP